MAVHDAEKADKMPKVAPEKPKRRVSVARKKGSAEVDPDVRIAIAEAVAKEDIESMRQHLIDQEEQLAALRCIMMDMLSEFRKQRGMTDKTVTKSRFAGFVKRMETTLNTNMADLIKHHPDQSDIEDLIEGADEELRVTLERLGQDNLREIIAGARGLFEGEGGEDELPQFVRDFDDSLLDEILAEQDEQVERAVAEMDADEDAPQTHRRLPGRRRRRNT